MSEGKLVELTISIPKPVFDFFEAYWKFLGYDTPAKQHLSNKLALECLQVIRSLVFDEEISDHEEALIRNHGLEKYREAMGFPDP